MLGEYDERLALPGALGAHVRQILQFGDRHNPAEPAGSRWEALGTAGPKLLLDAARTARDRAILAAMLFGALHAGEVVTLRLGDVNPGDGWVVTGGARWPRRIVPVPPAFFAAVDAYLAGERPKVETDLLFLAFKGRYRGAPLSTGAIQDIVSRTSVPWSV